MTNGRNRAPRAPAPPPWTETAPESVRIGPTRWRTATVQAWPWMPEATWDLSQSGATRVTLSVTPLSIDAALAFLQPLRAVSDDDTVDWLYRAVAQGHVTLADVGGLVGWMTSEDAQAVSRLDVLAQQTQSRLRSALWILRLPVGDQARAFRGSLPIGPAADVPITNRMTTLALSRLFPARRPDAYQRGGWILGAWDNRWVSVAPVERVSVVGPPGSGRSTALRWLVVQRLIQQPDATIWLIDGNPTVGHLPWVQRLGPVTVVDGAGTPLWNACALTPGFAREETIVWLVEVVDWISQVFGHDPLPPSIRTLVHDTLTAFYDQWGLSADEASWWTHEALAWHPTLKPMPTVADLTAAFQTVPALAPLMTVWNEAWDGPLHPWTATGPLTAPPSTEGYHVHTVYVGAWLASHPQVTSFWSRFATYWQPRLAQTPGLGWLAWDDPTCSAPWNTPGVTVLPDSPDRPTGTSDATWAMAGTSTTFLAPAERQATWALGSSVWITPTIRHPVVVGMPVGWEADVMGAATRPPEPHRP